MQAYGASTGMPYSQAYPQAAQGQGYPQYGYGQAPLNPNQYPQLQGYGGGYGFNPVVPTQSQPPARMRRPQHGRINHQREQEDYYNDGDDYNANNYDYDWENDDAFRGRAHTQRRSSVQPPARSRTTKMPKPALKNQSRADKFFGEDTTFAAATAASTSKGRGLLANKLDSALKNLADQTARDPAYKELVDRDRRKSRHSVSGNAYREDYRDWEDAAAAQRRPRGEDTQAIAAYYAGLNNNSPYTQTAYEGYDEDWPTYGYGGAERKTRDPTPKRIEDRQYLPEEEVLRHYRTKSASQDREREQRKRAKSNASRQRANSISGGPLTVRETKHYTPNNVFLSFVGKDKFRVTSIMYQSTVDELRDRVVLSKAVWPYGVLYHKYNPNDSELSVQFDGQPWVERGQFEVKAAKIVLEIFSVLFDQGFVCTGTIDTGTGSNQVQQLVFSTIPSRNYPPGKDFFGISFTKGRRTLRFINAPVELAGQLKNSILKSFPQAVTKSFWDNDQSYNIDMARSGQHVDHPDLFTAHLLDYMHKYGFKLEAGICLGRSGLLGMMKGKELWVLRRTFASSS